jgi:ATP-dependent DNA helicase RecG
MNGNYSPEHQNIEYKSSWRDEYLKWVNIHKDYTDTSIQLSIYNEHLQIWNPGTLPKDLSIAMLQLKHPSRPRNKNIAEVFFKAGYIEAWGRGITKMIQSCKLAHFPEPIISETAGGIQVVFKKSEINLKVDLKTNLKNGRNLLTLMQQHPQITIPELSVALGKSRSSIKIYIQHLKQEGKIERVGAKKVVCGRYWIKKLTEKWRK